MNENEVKEVVKRESRLLRGPNQSVKAWRNNCR